MDIKIFDSENREVFSSVAKKEEKLAFQQAQLDRLQQELAATAANQSSSSQDVMAKLNKRSYQLKIKSNKTQFTLMSTSMQPKGS